MIDLRGKKGVIFGTANEKSLAWGIAKAVAKAGADLWLTYQGEVLEKRVKPLAESIGARTLACDVADEKQCDAVFAALEKETGGRLDFLVHAIAYAGRDALKGRYMDTSREDFLNALNISCFSLVDLTRRACALMHKGGAVLTLSYYGAEKVIPNYNVMGVAKAALEASVRYLAADVGADGIRVNAISAGPVRTLAAAGVGQFRTMLKKNALAAPLRRTIDQDDVGRSALYFLSDLSGAVTGEVHYVDAGYNIIGLAGSGEE